MITSISLFRLLEGSWTCFRHWDLPLPKEKPSNVGINFFFRSSLRRINIFSFSSIGPIRTEPLKASIYDLKIRVQSSAVFLIQMILFFHCRIPNPKHQYRDWDDIIAKTRQTGFQQFVYSRLRDSCCQRKSTHLLECRIYLGMFDDPTMDNVMLNIVTYGYGTITQFRPIVYFSGRLCRFLS